MKVLFSKSRELPGCGLVEFFRRVRSVDFDAVELYLPEIAEKDNDTVRSCKNEGLQLVLQVATCGDTPAEHRDSLQRLCARAAACGAARINCHAGADWSTFADNARLFETGLNLEKELGVAICHETHRGRALYNAPDTARYLAELPDLKLTADLSHWQVVHETEDLARQSDVVGAVVDRAWHIHARVGCSQAPQVADPRAPEFTAQLETLLAVWRRILRARAGAGAEFV